MNMKLTIAAVAATVAAGALAYSDGYIETSDETVQCVDTGAGVAYVFTDASQAHTLQVKTANPVDRVLLVGGGGGGGYNPGGGGGGGGVTCCVVRASLDTSVVRTLVVGAGGSGGTSAVRTGGNGSNTSFQFDDGEAVAYGGGGGAGRGTQAPKGTFGSTGGGAWCYGAGTSATPGQGFSGGASVATSNGPGAGGGGAGEKGFSNSGNYGGRGGDGRYFSLTGAGHTYGSGGGGAGSVANDRALGGRESGGAGGYGLAGGLPGVDGLGGGGGGAGNNTGGKGGSGTIVIVFAKSPVANWLAARLPVVNYPATGAAVCPLPVVTAADGTVLRPDVDYTLSYSDNVAVGEAKVFVTGKGDYANAKDVVAFRIVEGYCDAFLATTDASVRVIDTPGGMVYAFTNTTADIYGHVDEPFVFRMIADKQLVQALLVGGGGAGGLNPGGGGGGGGVIFFEPAEALGLAAYGQVRVGMGGRGTSDATICGSAGAASFCELFGTNVVAYGGSGGGSRRGASPSTGNYGSSGGGSFVTTAGGAAFTATQGCRGGSGTQSGSSGGGGGGGAAENGGNADGSVGGAGGDGRPFTVTGERHVYGSGGGGYGATRGAGGEEGGGCAEHLNGVDGLGGGGAGAGSSGSGANGGSGTVILVFAKGNGKNLQAHLTHTAYPFSGEHCRPVPSVVDRSSGAALTNGTQYTVSYENNNAPGPAKVIVTGVGDYEGAADFVAFDIEDAFRDENIVAMDAALVKYETESSVSYAFTNPAAASLFYVRSALPVVDVLVAGGGGGGGLSPGGGGGGGGVLTQFVGRVFSFAQEMSASVGRGGSAVAVSSSCGSAGGETALRLGDLALTAWGGSGGGSRTGASPSTGSYGSSGGGSWATKAGGAAYDPAQGNRGGSGNTTSTGAGGGGGGAGAVGGESSDKAGGNGGDGIVSFVSGAYHVYGSGGGGAGTGAVGGAGGADGGGRGYSTAQAATSGVDGLGGGGGGGATVAGKGGTGAVILRFPKTATSIVADIDAHQVPYDGQNHRVAVDVRYPAGPATVKWSLTGEPGSFTLDAAPACKVPGSYTVWGQVTVAGCDPLVFSRTLTITDPSPENQTRWFVKPDGIGNPFANGLYMETATTLSNAIASVKSGVATGYTEIVLDAGEIDDPAVYDFSETPAWAGTDYQFSLNRDCVCIRSNAEDLDARRVVIRGARTRGLAAENARGFLTTSGNVRLEGLTVRDFYTTGRASVVNCSGSNGASADDCIFANNYGTCASTDSDNGTMFYNNSGTFRRCVFRDNGTDLCGTAVNGPAPSALMCTMSGTITLEDCRIEGTYGAYALHACRGWINAVRCVCAENSTGILLLWNATNRGGSLTDCEIVSNDLSGASAAVSLATGGVTVRDCRIAWNTASRTTTALLGSVVGSTVVSNLGVVCSGSASGSVFRHNEGKTFGSGAFTDCVIADNLTTNQLLSGNVTLRQCLVARNASSAEMVNADGGRFVLENTTLADNVCGASSAAVAGTSDQGVFLNSIVFGNTPADVKPRSAGAYVVTNLVYGVRSGANDFAAGSLAPIQTDVVPFLRTSDAKHPYGYSPKRRSAARDAGCNAVSSYDETSLDLAGEPRIVDGAIDCGCYERQKSKSGLLITVR